MSRPNDEADCWNNRLAKPDLTLPKTGVKVNRNDFWRENEDGSVLTRFPTQDIQSVSFSRPLNPSVFVFLAAGFGVVAIGRFLTENNSLAVLLYVVAVPVFAIGLLGAKADRLTVTRRSGEQVVFDCDETDDIVRQFVSSLSDFVK